MKILLLVITLVTSFIAQAQQPLSKVLIEKYFSTVDKFQVLEQKYPEMESQLADIMQLTPEQAIEKIQATKAFSDIENLVKSAGYQSFEQFYQQSYRIMASVFAAQMAQLPQDMDSMEAQLMDSIAQLKNSGMPPEMLKKMEQQMLAQKKHFASMSKLASAAKEQDVAFITKNMEWLMKIIPSEQEQGAW